MCMRCLIPAASCPGTASIAPWPQHVFLQNPSPRVQIHQCLSRSTWLHDHAYMHTDVGPLVQVS